MLEDKSIQGAQGILINLTGSSTLAQHEIHEATTINQKAAHENATINFGAVLDEAMKESVKITVIAAGFREVAGRKPQQRPAYLPKTWKATRDPEPEQEPEPVAEVMPPPRQVPEVIHQEATADDLDVPTFLRRQAQKA